LSAPPGTVTVSAFGADPTAHAGLRHAVGVAEVLVPAHRVRAHIADLLIHLRPAIGGGRRQAEGDDVHHLRMAGARQDEHAVHRGAGGQHLPAGGRRVVQGGLLLRHASAERVHARRRVDPGHVQRLQPLEGEGDVQAGGGKHRLVALRLPGSDGGALVQALLHGGQVKRLEEGAELRRVGNAEE